MQRVCMLLAKAELFGKAGKPERGFSVALRAASVSFKARLMPCLWAAVGVLSNILNSIGEFEAARRLLNAVIPQVCVFFLCLGVRRTLSSCEFKVHLVHGH